MLRAVELQHTSQTPERLLTLIEKPAMAVLATRLCSDHRNSSKKLCSYPSAFNSGTNSSR